MAKDEYRNLPPPGSAPEDDQGNEAASLLSVPSDDASDVIVHGDDRAQEDGNDSPTTPRTPNRVRFQLDEPLSGGANGHVPPGEDSRWLDEDDYMTHNAAAGERRDSTSHRAPLLTDIEAPSVTVASADVGFNANDLLENARPKSGMRSAFMNMANSIM